MEPLLDRIVFSVADREYRWADAILAAVVRGTWEEVERDARLGLAAEAAQEASPEELNAAEVTAAAHRFRYERNLLSADETVGWLQRFGLDEGAWLSYLRRKLLRERLAGDVPQAGLPDRDVEQVVLGEAVCSGELAESAEWLAGAVAVAYGEDGSLVEVSLSVPKVPGLDRDVAGPRLAEIARLARVFEDRMSRAVPDEEVEREIAARRLDWVALEMERAILGSADAAREVILLVAEDGLPLSEAAAAAGTQAVAGRPFLEDLDADLRDLSLGATPGAIVGPVATEGGWVVARVGDRTDPDPSDATVRSRAVDALRSRLVEREKNARVRWHERI